MAPDKILFSILVLYGPIANVKHESTFNQQISVCRSVPLGPAPLLAVNKLNNPFEARDYDFCSFLSQKGHPSGVIIFFYE